MATTTFVPQTLPGRLVTLGAFAILTFFVLVLAVGYAPVVVPNETFTFIGVWYFALLSLVSSVAVGLPVGLAFGLFFPRRTLRWALASSVMVGLVYLSGALLVRSGHTGHLWWTPFTDAILFVGMFTGFSCLASRSRSVDTI